MSPMLALLSDLTVSIVRIKLEAAEIIKQSLVNLIVSDNVDMCIKIMGVESLSLCLMLVGCSPVLDLVIFV